MITEKFILWWTSYFGTAVVCRLVFGKFPTAFFAFPVNAAVALLLFVGLWIAWRDNRKSAFMNFLSSKSTTILLLSLFAITCIVQGIINREITTSWWLASLLIAIMSHALIISLRGIKQKRPYKLRFILIHIGFIAAMTGGFIGAPDTKEWRIPLQLNAPTNEAIDKNGNITVLDHDIQLTGTDIEQTASGMPSSYKAQLLIDGKQNVRLEVNHPYGLSWQDDVYLSAIGMTGTHYCILQIIRQPWKHIMWTGIWMMIAGCFLLFLQGLKPERRINK